MKNSLYQIETKYIDLMSTIEDAEGEITEDMELQLSINESELKTKSIAYLQVIKTKESFNTLLDDEIKRLQALKKRSNNIVDKLKGSLLNAVKLFGEIETPLNKFGIRKSSSVEVLDVNELPKEYKVVKVTEQADKKKIKEALQNGVEIKGCTILEKSNLKIN